VATWPCRHPCHGRGVASVLLGSYAQSRTFFTGTPTAAIRWRRPSPAPASTCSREERTLEKCPKRWRICSGNCSGFAGHSRVGSVRQRGLLAGVELVRDRITREPYPWAERRGQRVCDVALRKGVWLRPLGNVVVIMPPLAISVEELTRSVRPWKTVLRTRRADSRQARCARAIRASIRPVRSTDLAGGPTALCSPSVSVAPLWCVRNSAPQRRERRGGVVPADVVRPSAPLTVDFLSGRDKSRGRPLPPPPPSPPPPPPPSLPPPPPALPHPPPPPSLVVACPSEDVR